MNDRNAMLESRIDELEARVAFQEATMNELSDALAQARIESARGIALIERAIGELRDLRTQGQSDPSLEPPPPHY